MTDTGILYLIPNVLSEKTAAQTIAPQVAAVLPDIRFFIYEEIRSARQLVRGIDRTFPIDDSQWLELTKKTDAAKLKPAIDALKAGQNVGLMSEAGCPGIADPGALMVELCHKQNIRVAPLVGPSSFFLGLMASGLNGQAFAFSGYLPIPDAERAKAIKRLESESARLKSTQIFMDTPYRNLPLFETCLKVLAPDTRLCIAAGLTGPNEWIKTKTVSQWQKAGIPPIAKIPTVFLLLA